jgi:hypothetical protein
VNLGPLGKRATCGGAGSFTVDRILGAAPDFPAQIATIRHYSN